MITQVLCPQRHCIAAGLFDTEQESGAEVLHNLKLFIGASRQCGICGSPASTFKYETEKTKFETMAEANKVARQLEAEQLQSKAALDQLGVTYDARQYWKTIEDYKPENN